MYLKILPVEYSSANLFSFFSLNLSLGAHRTMLAFSLREAADVAKGHNLVCAEVPPASLSFSCTSSIEVVDPNLHLYAYRLRRASGLMLHACCVSECTISIVCHRNALTQRSSLASLCVSDTYV